MLGPSDSRVRRAQGVFFDGQSAQARPVSVNVLSNGLQIYGEGAQAHGQWSFDGLRPLPPAPDEEAQFMHRDHPDARLVITDASVVDRIRSVAPQVLARQATRGGALRIIGMAALLIAILAGIVFVVLPRSAGVIAGTIPKQWEKDWGRSFAEQFKDKNKVCNEPAGRAALDALTARLLATEPARGSGYDFTFTVIETRSQNAFATLGGQVVVFSKLIEEMEGPDELAGVLAHEIGHVTERHPLKGLIEATFTMTFAGLFGGGSSDMGGGMASLGGVLAVTSYSRDKERQADEVGARILDEAHVSLDGLSNFFERLKKKAGGRDSGALALFSTHPALGARAAQLRELGTGGAPTRPALSADQWRALKRICG